MGKGGGIIYEGFLQHEYMKLVRRVACTRGSPIGPNFQNFVGAAISTNFKMKEAPVTQKIFKQKAIMTFFISLVKILLNFLLELKHAGYDTFGWVFQAEKRSDQLKNLSSKFKSKNG